MADEQTAARLAEARANLDSLADSASTLWDRAQFWRSAAFNHVERALIAETELGRVTDALREATAWYRDHVTEDGMYDESMWGDPFAISPQLRAALACVDADRPTGNTT